MPTIDSDKHPQKTYEFLLALIDYQIKADREDLMLDMKERSVKSMMKPSQKPKQRATLARTASPTVPATEAGVRAEARITPAGTTSNRRRGA